MGGPRQESLLFCDSNCRCHGGAHHRRMHRQSDAPEGGRARDAPRRGATQRQAHACRSCVCNRTPHVHMKAPFYRHTCTVPSETKGVHWRHMCAWQAKHARARDLTAGCKVTLRQCGCQGCSSRWNQGGRYPNPRAHNPTKLKQDLQVRVRVMFQLRLLFKIQDRVRQLFILLTRVHARFYNSLVKNSYIIHAIKIMSVVPF